MSWPNCSPVTLLLLGSIPSFSTTLLYFLDVACNYVFLNPGSQSPMPLWLPSWLHSITSCALLLVCLRQVHCAATAPLSNLLPACCGEEQITVTGHALWASAEGKKWGCLSCSGDSTVQSDGIFRSLPETSDCGYLHAAQDTGKL